MNHLAQHSVYVFFGCFALLFFALHRLQVYLENLQWRKESILTLMFRCEPVRVNPSERRAWELLTQMRKEFGCAHSQDRRAWMSGRGQITSRHLGFVLTDSDFQPLLAIEVDGASHKTVHTAQVDTGTPFSSGGTRNRMRRRSCHPAGVGTPGRPGLRDPGISPVRGFPWTR